MRIMVTSWFSFEVSHTTAGDLVAKDLVCSWLKEAGHPFDVEVTPPFSGDLEWSSADLGLGCAAGGAAVGGPGAPDERPDDLHHRSPAVNHSAGRPDRGDKVIKGGKVVETGTHEELLAAGGPSMHCNSVRPL